MVSDKTEALMKKRFVRYNVGAELYSMSQKKFERMAHEAKNKYQKNHKIKL